MAFSDFQTAMSTIRTHRSNEAWESMLNAIADARTYLVELSAEGTVDGVSYRLNVDQLDKLEAYARERQPSATRDRILHTRTNYASR